MSTDLTTTIAPKSDQMNADDLIGGRTLTIKITSVKLLGGDQPVALHYEGDNGKPYKPGKSMRRVLVNVWGSDGNKYVGRSLTLYRDEKVQFGGIAVGGIRISHMSDIDGEITMPLTASKSIRKPFTVKPLKVSATKPVPQATAEPAKVDPQAPQSDFLIALDGRMATAPNKKEWVSWYRTNLSRIKNAERLDAFKKRNDTIFENLRKLGHEDAVDDVLALFNDIRQEFERL